MWEFSSADYRKDHVSAIEFPVFEQEPVDKDALARYERKIKGITNPIVRNLIRELQPYKTDPVDSPILIIHKMDIFDKHRELVLVASNVELQVPLDLAVRLTDYDDENSGLMPIELAKELKARHKPVLRVSFRKFGRRAIQPVVPGLAQLSNYIRRVAS